MSNLKPIDPAMLHAILEGPVDYVELRGVRHVTIGAMPLRGRSAALTGRACSTSRRHRAAAAIARVAEALASPRFVLFYAGFFSGCMATVALAMLWARVLS